MVVFRFSFVYINFVISFSRPVRMPPKLLLICKGSLLTHVWLLLTTWKPIQILWIIWYLGELVLAVFSVPFCSKKWLINSIQLLDLLFLYILGFCWLVTIIEFKGHIGLWWTYAAFFYFWTHISSAYIMFYRYEDSSLALHYGPMLRECIRHQVVARYQL